MDDKYKQILKRRLLTEKQVVAEWPFTLSWLRCERVKGNGIPFIKAGRRVFYDPADIEAYIAANRVTSTTARGV